MLWYILLHQEVSPFTLTHSHPPSLTHSLTCLHPHSLTHSLTYSHPHSLTHLLTHTLTHSLTHSLTYLLTPSLTHLLTPSLLTHSLAHMLSSSLTHLLTRWGTCCCGCQQEHEVRQVSERTRRCCSSSKECLLVCGSHNVESLVEDP